MALPSPPLQAATGDRFNINLSLSKNWEHLQTKYVGTGHPDITKLYVCGARGPGGGVVDCDFCDRVCVLLLPAVSGW